MNPVRHIAALVALFLALAASPRPALAQTKADAFAGKIPPVSGQLYQKAGRIEVTPSFGMSLNDAFFTKYFGGVDVGYHLSESWSASVSLAGGAAVRSGSAVRCTATAGCVNASESELRQVPGRVRAIAAVGLAWAPVYGKLNVLSEQVAHFDLAVLGGIDGIQRDEVLARDQAGAKPGAVRSYGFHAGLGAHLFFGEAVAARLVVKDIVYPVNVPNNGSGNDWQNQLFTEIGLSIFFPTHNRQR
ncbi:MAG TPA: outer membrane beta-barrel domain-containing protein [Anaeromyxobacter sp.]